jgi:hypothetical protein
LLQLLSKLNLQTAAREHQGQQQRQVAENANPPPETHSDIAPHALPQQTDVGLYLNQPAEGTETVQRHPGVNFEDDDNGMHIGMCMPSMLAVSLLFAAFSQYCLSHILNPTYSISLLVYYFLSR